MTSDTASLFQDFFRSEYGYLPGPRPVNRVPADWVDEAYERIELDPVAPTVGAVVRGVDLAEPLDDGVVAELHRALLEWKVLFFRDQQINDDDQQRVAEHFGSLDDHPFSGAANIFGGPSAKVMTLQKSEKAGGGENFWHVDMLWRADPPMAAILRANEIPDVGGDTLFADMASVYDGLADEVKAQIDDATAVNDWYGNFGLTMPPEDRDRIRADFPAVEHPVVRTHPETGRRTLFVNRIFTQHIVGMDPDESTRLLDRLYFQITFPEYQCRWKWQVGDVVFWDNRALQHYASSDYFPKRRANSKVVIAGDRPY